MTDPVNTEIVLFDHPAQRFRVAARPGEAWACHGPADFPIATVRPRQARAHLTALVGSLQHWLAARWQWLRPRTVPCAVAALGMIAVIASANYLAHYKEDCALKAPAVHVDLATR